MGSGSCFVRNDSHRSQNVPLLITSPWCGSDPGVSRNLDTQSWKDGRRKGGSTREQELCAAKERQSSPGLFVRHVCVPDLRRPTTVDERCETGQRTRCLGGEVVGLEFDRGEAAAFGQARDAPVTARRIGEGHHARRVQVTVRSEVDRPELHSSANGIVAHQGDLNSEVSRQVAEPDLVEVGGRAWMVLHAT
jgi:hypothetical protein